MSHQSTMHENLSLDMVRTALLRLPVTLAPVQLAELMSRVALTRTDTGLCNHHDEKCRALLRTIPLALTASQVVELVRQSFPEGRDSCDRCREQAAAAEFHDEDLVLIQAGEDSVGNAASSDDKSHRTPLPTLDSRSLAKTSLAKLPPMIHASSSSQEDVSGTSNQGDTTKMRRYDRLKMEGKCVTCGGPRMNSRYRQKLKNAQCVQCSKPRGDARIIICSTCQAKNKASRDRKRTMAKV
ncbi:hypothetical protein PFICI_02500 [Pestalotiopsis fici W106-1]|uniref:Uncharacterized protein n=1 Tax=Pestalotiopsis fici (strain W106-1 / CGMCC3.15140) TaxID=1229662 RepID=W3XEJ9_PESFW|nr:uncharacterized protein PFICI_02500 [Pestalotiopsis fici W106-1]ETS84475.1 hypothetical protein PFICI_02500 [Pestalotiopsis fici W106-1]